MPDETTHTHCKNCGTPLDGGFCAQCGQSGKDYDLPVGDFAKEFASETLSLDSRLRLTLEQLILRPGLVPKEYVEGRRARFVPPVRLYIFASFAMFLLLTFGDGVVNIGEVNTVPATEAVDSVIGALAPEAAPDTVRGTQVPEAAPDTAGQASTSTGATELTEAPPGEDDASGQLAVLVERFAERFFEALARADADKSGFADVFLTRVAQAMFFLLPAFAVFLKLVYRGRLYVHHLVFSIYFHSFAFLLTAVAALPGAVGWSWGAAVADTLVLWTPVYLYLGMRRFYGQGRGRTLLKFGLVSVGYWTLGSATVAGLMLFSLLTF